MKLYKSSGFSLGKTETIRLQVVQKFRQLLKDSFATIVTDATQIIIIENDELLDISEGFLHLALDEDSDLLPDD